MSRILWLGDAGCVTGFATVSHAIGDRLVTDYGHDVHCLATNYNGDYWPTPMKLYVPKARGGLDVWGTNRFVELIGSINPEVVVSLNDPLVLIKHLLKNRWDPDLILARYAPILAYMPIDGANYPEVFTRIPELVKGLSPIPGAPAASPMLMPVVMSKFGNTVFPGAPLVYHGVDTDRWKPAREKPVVMSDGTVVKSKTDARRALGLPTDCILALRVDRNSLRKNFADTVLALVPAMRQEPKLHAWLHCQDTDIAGIDLNLFVSRFPDVQDRFHWPGNFDTVHGWNEEALRCVVSAADFTVSTSGGEGFGLNLAESLAMEVPVIAMNCSAIPEVVGPGGYLLQPERTYVPLSGQDNWLPDVDAFTKTILGLANSRGARKSLGQAGRAHVLANFGWPEAARRFHELITAMVQKTSGVPVAGGTP